ncbi:PREDICTED: proline-rich nuclear receptor coactivator 2 [Polistes dominula]|uniref:Proline-rich nuclear receptor coactivator 2 n=1 Tax=Polistes dominula TaxID=743375 RepID=A0ABM1IV97_POLDO|nr:PREDICTED: proline-rich nuclear receptor coactivator 2 [Polistes dominula]
MTNSGVKLNNKFERQGSPNSGGKKYHRSNSMKSPPFNHNTTGGRSGNKNGTNNNSTGRLSCSPTCTGKSSRNSPSKSDSSGSQRGSPTNSFYAGAKFSETPSPTSLPKPPDRWTIGPSNNTLMSSCQESERRLQSESSNHLKMILNVKA